MKKTLIFKCALMTSLVFLGISCAHEKTAPTIEVTGKAVMKVAPDKLIAVGSVVTRNKRATAAQEKNDEKVRDILDFLKETGIPEKDISTGYVRLFEWYKEGSRREDIFMGYEAHKSIKVVLYDLALYQKLMTEVVELGMNRVWEVDFESTEFVGQNQEARKMAIRAAREKADYLAAELGQQVGKAIRITEVSSGGGYYRHNPASNIAFESDFSGSFVTDSSGGTIMPDSIKIEQQVKVVFELK